MTNATWLPKYMADRWVIKNCNKLLTQYAIVALLQNATTDATALYNSLDVNTFHGIANVVSKIPSDEEIRAEKDLFSLLRVLSQFFIFSAGKSQQAARKQVVHISL